MPALARCALRANVSCAAAEAFITSKNPKTLTGTLLSATKQFHDELRGFAEEQQKKTRTLRSHPPPDEKWIDFTAAKPKPKARAAEPPAKLLPKVIAYDTETGKPLSSQETREEKKEAAVAVVVPWKEWQASAVAKALDAVAADEAAITQVLRSIHCEGRVQEQDVDVLVGTASRNYVAVAAADLEANTLELPPCVPKAGKVHTASSHPHRVAIKVQPKGTCTEAAVGITKKSAAGAAVAIKAAVAATYYVHPEYNLPLGRDEDEEDHEVSMMRTSLWKWRGDETLHPFWAVGRLSATELHKNNTASRGKHVFNMGLVDKVFAVVTVGSVKGESVAMTTEVTVPMMTNIQSVRRGDELIMEIAAKGEAGKRKAQSWKEDAQAKPKAKAKPKATAKATSYLGVGSEV